MPGDKRCDIMTVLAGVSLARAWYKVRPEERRGVPQIDEGRDGSCSPSSVPPRFPPLPVLHLCGCFWNPGVDLWLGSWELWYFSCCLVPESIRHLLGCAGSFVLPVPLNRSCMLLRNVQGLSCGQVEQCPLTQDTAGPD